MATPGGHSGRHRPRVAAGNEVSVGKVIVNIRSRPGWRDEALYPVSHLTLTDRAALGFGVRRRGSYPTAFAFLLGVQTACHYGRAVSGA